MKNKKLLANLLFAVVILAIAAVLLVVRRVHASGSGLRAELIYGDNNTTMNLPLTWMRPRCGHWLLYRPHSHQGRCSPVRGFALPGHICKRLWLVFQRRHQTATCLPARAVLTIVPVSRQKGVVLNDG